MPVWLCFFKPARGVALITPVPLARRLPLGAITACVVVLDPKPLCVSPNIWLCVLPYIITPGIFFSNLCNGTALMSDSRGSIWGLAKGNRSEKKASRQCSQFHTVTTTSGLWKGVSRRWSRSVYFRTRCGLKLRAWIPEEKWTSGVIDIVWTS